jgi:HEAT repeat protein
LQQERQLDHARMAIVVRDQTWSLITPFLSRSRVWGVLAPSDEQLLAHLNAITDCQEPEAAALIWPGISGRSEIVRHRALEVMTELLAQTTPKQLMIIIRDCQGCPSYWEHQAQRAWWDMTPDMVRDISALRPACVGMLALLSGHHSGYIREAALKGINGIEHPCVMPIIRERLNDWVEPVRHAALLAMLHYLSVDHAKTLVSNLDLLDNLSRQGRVNHQPLIQQIETVLEKTACRPFIIEGLESPVSGIRRRCLSILLRVTNNDEQWLKWGLTSPDTWIRIYTATIIKSLPLALLLDSYVDLMAKSRTRPVRQLVIDIIVAQYRPEILPRLMSFLTDRSATLREYSRYYLNKILGNFDARTFYRQGLASTPLPQTANFLLGVGETGDASDIDTLLPYTQHQQSAVQLAALRSLARLAPPSLIEPFLLGINSRSGRIRQVASAALAARREHVPIGTLTTFHPAPKLSTQRCIVMLLGYYPASAHLPALLPFLKHSDQTIRTAAERICLRSLSTIINPFNKPVDPWRVWAESHNNEWSTEFQSRVNLLIRKIFGRR